MGRPACQLSNMPILLLSTSDLNHVQLTIIEFSGRWSQLSQGVPSPWWWGWTYSILMESVYALQKF